MDYTVWSQRLLWAFHPFFNCIAAHLMQPIEVWGSGRINVAAGTAFEVLQ